MIKLYDEYADLRDRFEILAVHDNAAKSLAEMDEKLADKDIVTKYWDGKELPFPILLDGKRETITAWGVNSFPTVLLIDPEGKLQAGSSAAKSTEKLEEILQRMRKARSPTTPTSD